MEILEGQVQLEQNKKKLASNEKQAIRIIDSECYDIREKMSEINILNIHKINIY